MPCPTSSPTWQGSSGSSSLGSMSLPAGTSPGLSAWKTPPHPLRPTNFHLLLQVHSACCFNLPSEPSPETSAQIRSAIAWSPSSPMCLLSSTYHSHHSLLTMEALLQICLPARVWTPCGTSAFLCLHPWSPSVQASVSLTVTFLEDLVNLQILSQ